MVTRQYNEYIKKKATPLGIIIIFIFSGRFPLVKPLICSLKPGTHDTIFSILDATTHPSRGESLVHLVTKLKYLEDASSDPGDAPHKVACVKLDIKPAGYPACSQ